MTIPALADLDGVEGARVLTRLDLNVPIDNGSVQDDTRIVAAIPTLRWLGERASVIAACSHLGKAKGTPDPAYTLAPVAPVLAEALGRPVRFVDDCLDPSIADAEPGTVLLLENLRFHPGEKANDEAFAARLTASFSHYVNDAFGTAHRDHASVSAAPRRFRKGRKAAGFLMAAEVAALSRVVRDPEQPFVAAVGGAKISTKTAPLEALLDRVRTLLIGGGMANTFLKARGYEIGRSLVEDEMLPTARDVMDTAAERGIEVLIPTDVIVTDALDAPSIPPTSWWWISGRRAADGTRRPSATPGLSSGTAPWGCSKSRRSQAAPWRSPTPWPTVLGSRSSAAASRCWPSAAPG
jgi:phosphoglycerate kinase